MKTHLQSPPTRSGLNILKLLMTSILLLSCSSLIHAQVYPANFSQVLVASGISNPTVMAFAPDGRIFVAQQNGQLRVIKNGALLATPFVSLSVSSSGERGLLGIAFDPNFATNNFIYLYYTLSSEANNRISRFTANGDVAVAGSEVVILNLDPLSSATNHNGGNMQFGPDGKLYVAIGENANGPQAQNLDLYHGKILRINSDGSVPSGNPFPSGSAQRMRVWAYGLRNPYTIAFQPGTGKLFVNDVGQSTWEEINNATTGGLNFGWPTAEGNSTNTAFTNPVYQYANDAATCAITGGTFFNPPSTNYPATYIGKYFYIDYCGNWINSLNHTVVPAASTGFASGVAGLPVGITTGPDGNLYFLSRSNGGLYKVIYNASTAPVITTQPQSQTVSQNNPVTFSVTATGTAPLSYQWRKNGVNISGAISQSYNIASAQPTHSGTYSVVVSNSVGSATSNNATLTVNAPNQIPTATINAPTAGAHYNAGTTISYNGTGTDPEQGTLGASAFQWYVMFHHDTHVHPGPTAQSGVTSGSFSIPNSGETATNVWYRLYLVVTDAQGAKDTAFTDILPNVVTLNIATNPSGLQVTLDGQPFTSPKSTTSVVGMLRSIGTSSPQTLGATSYNFNNWSNGGTQTQTITTPTVNTTYTANFSAAVGNQTFTLTPVADSYVRAAGYATTNYGTSSQLYTKRISSGDDQITYLRFNISSFGNTVSSAKLRLYGRLNNSAVASVPVEVHEVTNQTWVETTINYNNRPAMQPTVIATTTVGGNTSLYYEWNIMSLVAAAKAAGSTTISVALRNTNATSSSRVLFNSKEATASKPQLVVVASPFGQRDEEPENSITDFSSNVNIFPNPASTHFNIQVPEELQNALVAVYDMNGRLVKELQQNDLTTNITTENFTNGVYIINMQNDKATARKKIIIER